MYYPQVSITDPIIKLLLLLSIRLQTQRDQSVPFEGCKLNITNGTALGNIPIILNNDGPELSLELPHNGSLNVPTSKNLILLCPGPGNFLINSNKNKSEATCETTKQLTIDKDSHNFETILCKKPVSADIVETKNNCAIHNKELLIGYKIEPIKEQDFLRLIRVCYNETNITTLYTEHTLYGSSIKNFSRSTPRPQFSLRGIGTDNITIRGYTRFMQKATFSYLLGSEKLAAKYINYRSFLSRGHLSPHADFLISSTQRSSYFYVNACPQWQSINGGNWNTLEMMVRKVAEVYNKTLTIFTGTYDVLDLPNVKNQSVKIYLSYDFKLPVPKYVWKVVYDPETKDAIALINYNNPFAKSAEGVEFCKNICEESGWYWKNWIKFRKGYIFCCEVDELRKIVKHVPDFEVADVIPGVFFKLE